MFPCCYFISTKEKEQKIEIDLLEYAATFSTFSKTTSCLEVWGKKQISFQLKQKAASYPKGIYKTCFS